MMAASPFTEYTAGAVMYVLVIAVLVMVLLGGGFLLINFGLLSKRETDRSERREPSDLGILKNRVWPEEASVISILPAEENEEELQRERARIQERLRRKAARRAS